MYCREEILFDAEICKHCNKHQWSNKTIKNIKIFCGLAFLFLIITFFIPDSPAKIASDRYDNSKYFAEEVIKKILKSPTTAEFSDVKAYEFTDLKDVWGISGYVDSQNSFGAMIRSNFGVYLDYRDGKGGEVMKIIFDGKEI
jgi:hypothetical protein